MVEKREREVSERREMIEDEETRRGRTDVGRHDLEGERSGSPSRLGKERGKEFSI